MTVSFSGLLWTLLIVALLVFIAYWWGRRSSGSGAPRLDAPISPPAAQPRLPTAAPPPANAGSEHHPAARQPLPEPVAPRPEPAARAPEPRQNEPPAPIQPPRTPGAVPPPWIQQGKGEAAPGADQNKPRSETRRSVPPPASGATTATAGPATAVGGPRLPLSEVRSWGYQLQGLDIANAAASPFDLLVIDYSKDGSDEAALKPADLARLKRKPNGGRRLVIAYLSIGEAESYRYYWNERWKRNKPAWMLGENPEWKENYAVCFWEPDWQRMFCGAPDAYVDKIMAAGFDGIYLDKCDVFDDLRQRYKKVANSRPDIERDMVAFVERISRYVKAKDPGFVVIMQNAEGLIDYPALLQSIDGVGKEELVYGVAAPEKLNSREEFEWSRGQLAKARAAGKLILVVEYLNDQAKIRHADQVVSQAGFVLFISPKDRELAKLPYRTFEA